MITFPNIDPINIFLKVERLQKMLNIILRKLASHYGEISVMVFHHRSCFCKCMYFTRYYYNKIDPNLNEINGNFRTI